MDFLGFKSDMQKHVKEMLSSATTLYVADVDNEVLWNTYLDSYPEGTNNIYKVRREYDCNCCKQFIRRFGKVVTINNGKVTSIWDFNTTDPRFQPVAVAMSKLIHSANVQDVYSCKDKAIGTNYSVDADLTRWNHFHLELPKHIIPVYSETEGTYVSNIRTLKEVFQRSLDEISENSVVTVLELISQNSLYKGAEWDSVLKQFNKLQKAYKLSSNKDLFCWEQSKIAGPVIGKIKNHSIGTLLVDITEDKMELDKCVARYEAIVAPSNYKRPTAIFTKQMLEAAKTKIIELGYSDSLGRRFANVNDITVNNILFANRDTMKVIEKDVFADLALDIPTTLKTFDKTEEITISDFISKVLPTVTEMELFVENRHSFNFMSLIAPAILDSKHMFKWPNNFSWAYTGNITDSMKERVKSAGGKTDGELRFSIQWNDHGDNDDDLDAHCICPDRSEICFHNRKECGGELDIDIRKPSNETKDGIAVENITFATRSKMKEGKYLFSVHNFFRRNSKRGFTAEVECDGELYSFEYASPVQNRNTIDVAEVTFSKTTGFKVKPLIDNSFSSKKTWNVDSNQFHPVTVAMMSPNYWDNETGIGNKHYFFMLKNCINNSNPNGFFNEYLKEELLVHRKVFEALGSKMAVGETTEQLSGLGFSSTKRENVIVRIKGAIVRTLKIIF